MTAHKHYEMIVAKAANMDLILFARVMTSSDECEWIETNFADICSNPNKVFFACLPQHKEACLHWLNGGEAQQRPINESQWVTSADANKVTWKEWTSFMKGDLEFRIKPRKENLWVAYHKNGFMFNEVGLSETDIHHRVKDHELSDFVGSDWQYKEIEVEV